MSTPAAPTPVLQIVHISDLHFHVGPAPQNDKVVRHAIAALAKVRPSWGGGMLEYWEDGRAGHATDALVAFESFWTGNPLPNDPSGTPQATPGSALLHTTRIPTWLIDTGDLASVGDDQSVQTEIAWVDRMRGLMGAKEVVRIYGNHDAWPGKFPLVSSKAQIATHRLNFRNKRFPAALPLHPLTIPIGSTGNRIDLYAVNSVIHDRPWNTVARGMIKVDPHWGGFGSKDQLPELARSVAHRAASMSGQSFRILLSHHPIHYPPPKPFGLMSLRDEKGVAKRLLSAPKVSGALVHLVLSGHTHGLYPTFGGLPPNTGTPHHPPLGLHQMQLVTGSLSKAIRQSVMAGAGVSNGVDDEPHQFQVVRFFELPGYPNSLVMKRAIIGRNNGTGRFAFKALAPGGGAWEDSILDF